MSVSEENLEPRRLGIRRGEGHSQVICPLQALQVCAGSRSLAKEKPACLTRYDLFARSAISDALLECLVRLLDGEERCRLSSYEP